LCALIGFAAIGFIDDYAKVSKQRNLGLTAKKKIHFQILSAWLWASPCSFLATYSKYSTTLFQALSSGPSEPLADESHPGLVATMVPLKKIVFLTIPSHMAVVVDGGYPKSAPTFHR